MDWVNISSLNISKKNTNKVTSTENKGVEENKIEPEKISVVKKESLVVRGHKDSRSRRKNTRQNCGGFQENCSKKYRIGSPGENVH